MEVVPTERLCGLYLNTSDDGRLATPGSPWVFTALINSFFFFSRQTKSLWKEIESGVFSAELVKTRSRSAGTLPCAIWPSKSSICERRLCATQWGPPSLASLLLCHLLLLRGDYLPCLHSHPFVCELGHHPLICLRRRSSSSPPRFG